MIKYSKKLKKTGGDYMLNEKRETDYLNEVVIFLGKRTWITKEGEKVSAFSYLNILSGEPGEISIKDENLNDGRGADEILFGSSDWKYPVFVILRDEKRSRFGSQLNLAQIKKTEKIVELAFANS